MNLPDLIDGFITWQSTPPCRANQETPFVDERVFQYHGFAGKRFLSSLPFPLLALFLHSPKFSRVQSKKCFKPAESPTLQKGLLRRLNHYYAPDKNLL